jgi:hypothetical protein
MALIDIDDYLDKVDTDDLIEELKSRSDLPSEFNYLKQNYKNSRTPIRDTIIEILNLGIGATIEDIQEAIKDSYYK